MFSVGFMSTNNVNISIQKIQNNHLHISHNGSAANGNMDTGNDVVSASNGPTGNGNNLNNLPVDDGDYHRPHQGQYVSANLNSVGFINILKSVL